MPCLRHLRVFMPALLGVLLIFSAPIGAQTAVQDPQNPTSVTLRWGARPGVSRYRLQLAQDANFSDIVFDRVVNGHEYRISELSPGRYFWRVASLGAEFSSAGVIEIPREPITKEPDNAIKAVAGWYAAVGSIASPVLARLRSPNTLDVVARNADGNVFALDASNGVALWTWRPKARSLKADGVVPPISVSSRNGLDDVLVVTGNVAVMLEGRTGRELWRSTLPGYAVKAVAFNSQIYFIDNSLRTVFVAGSADGKILASLPLPRPAVGAPAILESHQAVMVALDDGRIAVIDQNGKLAQMADAASPATTAPVFVRNARGGLVLIGTKSGLTALDATGLKPLGRITLKDEAPRGTLSVRDLDADGLAEVILITDRGRVIVARSDEGKIVWQSDIGTSGSVAFADVNGDRVLDLLMNGREGFAMALSGRDGALLWKEQTTANANHAGAATERAMLVAPAPGRVLLISGDSSRGGLRAVEFSKSVQKP
jgi:PQQ-like domain